MSTGECVECGAIIQLSDDLMLGEIVECIECSAELEITGLNPLAIELAPEIEEDWGE
jgi:alpha-aminoadipate carrier protein LysW